jgi:hypothetical protein
VEERRDLCKPVAAPGGSDRCELRSGVHGERAAAQSSTPSHASSLRLSAIPASP